MFKWATKIPPAVSSTIGLEAFELALQIRRVDMLASPYDVSAYDLAPIAVETPNGKRECAELQGDFARRGGVLRDRIVAFMVDLRQWATAGIPSALFPRGVIRSKRPSLPSPRPRPQRPRL